MDFLLAKTVLLSIITFFLQRTEKIIHFYQDIGDQPIAVWPETPTRFRIIRISEEHRKVALGLMEGIASVLASRLRYTNAELRVLES